MIEMVDREKYCLDIIQQSQAVESALKKVDEILLEHHLKTCVAAALEKKKGKEEKINEVLQVFRRAAK